MDVSYQYIINSPSSNGEYTTTESELTIEGYTNNPDITEVHVNDYKVLSFDGNTWTYLASSNFGSLNV